MNLTVSLSSDKPIYRQIFEQVSSQIMRGELAPDDCLPPIRTVALELRVSVITVKKAWEELEHGGFIYTVAGRGCFVAALHAHEIEGKRRTLAEDKLAKDLEYYKSLGLTRDELLEFIQKNYE